MEKEESPQSITWICRPKGRLVLWPVICPMPADESAVKGRQHGGWLPVAERASPLKALQAAGTRARRATNKSLGS